MRKPIELPPGFDINEYIGTRKRIPPEVVEAVFGTPEDVRRALEEFSCRVAVTRSEAVRRKYGGEYVAVSGRVVIDHDPDWQALGERIDALDIDLEEVTIRRAPLPGEQV